MPLNKNNKVKQSQQIKILLSRLGLRSLLQNSNLILAMCLFFCSLIVSSLSYFSVGVEKALDQDIADFLGAPLVVRSSQPLAELAGDTINDLKVVQTISKTYGAFGKEKYHSIALKGVSSQYPAQGNLKISGKQNSTAVTGADLVNKKAWLDARALTVLGLDVGEQIQVAGEQFTVDAVIEFEPDRLTQLQHVLPRVMIHLDDFSQLNLATSSGTTEFRYLLTGAETSLSEFESSMADLIPDEHEILKPSSGQHPFAKLAQRADKMLGMVMVLVLLLCGSAAVLLADFTLKKYVLLGSVFRCMGLPRKVFSAALFIQLLIVSIMSGLAGGIIGWLLQPLLSNLLNPHLILNHVPFNLRITLSTLGISILTLLAFVYPRIRAMSLVPVSQVLRGHSELKSQALWSTLTISSTILIMLWYYSDNIRLTFYLTAGVITLVSLTWVFGWVLNKGTGLTHHINQGVVRVALRSIGRNPKKHMTIMATIALTVMALLMTSNLRGSFLDRYQVQRFSHDGNYLYSGLPALHSSEFSAMLKKQAVPIKGSYPTVSAYLFAINDVPIDEALNHESDTREETRSPVRLSWADVQPENNRMISGKWPEIGSGEVSVEAEVMSDLGLLEGDVLTFKINQAYLKTTISSQRVFKSGGSMMMFWFMFAPDTLREFNHQIMGGMEIPAGVSDKILRQIAAEFPEVLLTDLAEQVGRMRSIMSAITTMMNSILALLILAALTVLVASAFISLYTQNKQINLMRALGVVKKRVYLLLFVEQATVGFVACLIGVLGSQLIANLMFKENFGVNYDPNLSELFMIIFIVTACFSLLGATAAHLRLKKPMTTFQES